MWHSFKNNSQREPQQITRGRRPIERVKPGKLAAVALSAAAVWGSAALLPPDSGLPALSIQIGRAQADNPPPTFRYARGEDIDLAEIIAEWRGFYDDVPIYLCVCQDDICDRTEQWPYREYGLYQLGVALGPTNGRAAETSGMNCFDIADGSRPDDPRDFSAAQRPETERDDPPADASEVAPVPPAEAGQLPDTGDDSAVPAQVEPPPASPAPASPPPAASGIPTVVAVNGGAAIRLDWPSGASNVVDVAGSNWNITVLEALECESLSLVEQKIMEAQRVVGTPVVDATTGNVAVPVLLDFCVETDQSAVFVLDPNEGGGYSLYRTQLPGGSLSGAESTSFPDEFSSYAFSSITDIRYWNGSLYVQQGTASGAEAVVIFRPGATPAGAYAGCGVVQVNEGSELLCP